MGEEEIEEGVAIEGVLSFTSFLNNIFPLSWEGRWKSGDHLDKWAGMLANSKQTCILAPRKHSKSSTVYAYVMWLIFRSVDRDLEVLYISYKSSMAAYHLKNIRDHIERNIYFKQFKFTSDAETIIKGTWDDEHEIIVEPEGILCVHPEETVFTYGGIKKIKDVKIGDRVISHKGIWRRVLDKYRKKTRMKMNRIYFQNFLNPLTVSEDHKILGVKVRKCKQKYNYCYKGCSRENHCRYNFYKDYKLGWIESKNLNKGDLVVIPRYSRRKKMLNKYWWRIAGYYLAEGYLKHNPPNQRDYKICFVIGNKEKKIKEDIENIIDKLIGKKVYVENRKEFNSIILTVISKKLYKFLEKFGKGAHNKKIPFKYESELDLKLMEELIKCYYRGDGRKDANSLSISSVSLGLLESVQRILLQFDISSSIIRVNGKYKGKTHLSYRLILSNNKFRDMIGFKKKLKKKNIRGKIRFDKNYSYIRVKKIEKIDFDGEVFDLNVEHDHSFLSRCIISNSFKRGRHPHIVIIDDPLADPTTILDLGVIQKINRRFFEDASSLPKEGGEMKIIGTAQTPEDFFFDLKDNPKYAWGMYPAIISEKKKKVLWKERFPFKRLKEINIDLKGGIDDKGNPIWSKFFMKEYMIQPIYTTESFFTREQILSVVNPELKSLKSLKTENNVIMGWDVGKKVHPSHVSIFEVVDGIWIQRYQAFWDNIDYTEQLKRVRWLVERFDVNKCFFDATRGEFDGFYERGEMNRSKFYPISLSGEKPRFRMAIEFEKHVNNKTMELFDDRRMISQILNVTNDLKSVEMAEGHGDSFWSIALAVGNVVKDRFVVLEDVDRIL